MRAIFTDGFQETWDEGRPHHLELEALGVGDLYGGVSVIFMVQPLEILLVRALFETKRQRGEKERA